MLIHQTELSLGCLKHGIDCPYVCNNQPPNVVVGYQKSITEMYELCHHDCAMVQLYAQIGLLRRSRKPSLFSPNHPCLKPQFYEDFKQRITENVNFYLNCSSRTLISILSSIVDHDPTDSSVAAVALLLSRIEEITNTCIGFNPWQANPKQYKDACDETLYATLGLSYETCGTLYALFLRLAKTIKRADLVHQITAELYDRLLDPTSGYPYSPSMMCLEGERQHPNWIQMVSKQTDTEDFAKKIRNMICYLPKP